ncbi:MAG: ABC transporter substrate-binding protein [Phototrophicales bacterium]|nr:ABC transporter substrate-binding protein [Phototrophicales bacterium]
MAIVLCLTFSWIPQPQVSAQDLPRLVYIYPGSPQQDQAVVQEAMSAYMAERIGATIELRPVDWGAYNDQIGLINASGEQYDIAFTAPWINNYYSNVTEEYFIPLDDLLQEYAPNYWASMTPETWEAARVGGSIYGAINQQIFVKPFGPYIRTDVLEALGLVEQFEAITSYEDLLPILATIQEFADQDDVLTQATYNLAPLNYAENWGYDPIAVELVVDTTDATAQVQIYSQTEAYRKASQLIRDWYVAGYSPSDVAVWDEMDAAWTAGLYAVRVSDIVKPGGNAEVAARWGWEVISVAIAEPVLTTAGVIATLNGVSYTSEYPELAVAFLELLNTDPVFYNMLSKGLEGIHWEWEDQEALLIRPANGAASFADTGYNPNTDWMFGNVFNAYYTDITQVGAWPETAELNRNARPSPILGFTFDSASVATQIASVSAVIQEFGSPMGSGLIDVDEGIARLQEELQNAGIETIREEMQRQIDEWLANR